MSARIEYWRPKRGRVWHAFTEWTEYQSDGEPRVRCIALCDRHEFTLDSPSVNDYTPWRPWTKGRGPAKPLCEKCRKLMEAVHV